MNKRTFLKNTTLLGLSSFAGLNSFGKIADTITDMTPDNTINDENFWMNIRTGYKLKPDFINLENGYYCIQPQEILEKYFEHIREVNLQGAYYMRTVQFENKKAAAKRLAEIAGCNADELIITRNTTESLDMIISGFDWKAGDEAVMAEQDYGAMLDMFKQVAKRHGVVNKFVSVPLDPKTDEEIVALYERAITPNTKLLMVSHIINITGQILPIRKICDMAHSKNVQVMVDGAHALAHIKFAISDLNCDYYGASLHKWLSVPLGAGMLYVKKEHIGKIWQLFAEGGKKEDDISRLNHTGTIPVATDLTITNAIDYFLNIGAERKETRLRFLQNYWTDKVRHLPKVILNTPTDAARSCAIANVGIKGIKPAELADILLKKYKIYTVAIDLKIIPVICSPEYSAAGVSGCRITPNIYTTIDELDALVNAIKKISV